MLVFAEIGYSVTTRFLKMSTFHPRVFRGNPLCFISMAVTAVLQVFLTYTPGVNAFFSMPGVGEVWREVGSRVSATMLLETATPCPAQSISSLTYGIITVLPKVLSKV